MHTIVVPAALALWGMYLLVVVACCRVAKRADAE
jgi:hypothetical protein